jgi:large subunit ribosomal protein L13
MKTTVTPVTIPKWYVVDATGLTIGRISANAAHVLRGKHKPTFSPHQLCGDHVIVVNVEKLGITPAKGRRKTYFDHTGYLGSWSQTSLAEMMERHPERVIEMAVKGMLPHNRLATQMLKRLHVIVGPEHKYEAQKPVPLTFTV